MRFAIYLLAFALYSKAMCAQEKADTIKVYFDLGIPTLNEGARHQLDSLAYHELLLPGKKYGIIGYADYLGADSFNVTLSQNRANNVLAYIKDLGVNPRLVETVIGKGEVNRYKTDDSGYPEDRRVDIIPGGFKPTVQPAPKPVKIVTETPKNQIDISKVKTNETIRLDNIYFMPGSHKVRDISEEEMIKLLFTMRNNPKLKIQIEGHICCLMNKNVDGYDYDTGEHLLSENRAKAIYDYLAEKGIDTGRMKYIGLSNTKPLRWPEDTGEDQDMNRRVEIRILEK